MSKISLIPVLLVLAGCNTIGTSSWRAANVTDGTPSVRYASTAPSASNPNVLQAGDIQAINAAIAADDKQYWAPQDEVLQQRMQIGNY